MLGKLFKHEWKMGFRLFFAIHGCALIFAILSRLFLAVSGGLEQVMNGGSDLLSMIAALLMMGMVFIVVSVALFTYIYIGYRFYKNIFTDQGYLTNTLPVTPVQLIVSKGLVGVLWTVIDFFILILALLILFSERSFLMALGELFVELMGSLGDLPLSFWITVLSFILSPFYGIIHLYFCVAVGNLFNGHKVLGTVAAYIGSYTVTSILELVLMAFTGSKLFLTAGPEEGMYQPFMDGMNTMLISSLVLSTALALCYWFLTKYIMEKRLNLQ